MSLDPKSGRFEKKSSSDISPTIKVWYLYHSGYAVQLNGCLLIFDYWNDETAFQHRSLGNGVFDPQVWLNDTTEDCISTGLTPRSSMPVVIFSSHKHGDHFTPKILEWAKTLPRVKYVLSHDIPKRSLAGLPENVFREAAPFSSGRFDDTDLIIRMKPDTSYAFLDLNIEIHTFRSTDAGVAFWVNVGDAAIYHAGDLNLWHWEGESKAWNKNMRDKFEAEVAKIQRLSNTLPSTLSRPAVAFLPLDPRLENHWQDGYSIFMDKVGAKAVFPMHFGDVEALDGLRREPQPGNTQLCLPDKRGSCFALY